MEKASVRLQKDFDLWWTEQCELIEAKNNKHSEQLSNVVTSTSRGLGKLSIDSASSVASSIQSVNSSLFQSQVGSRPNSSLNSTAMSQLYYNQVSTKVHAIQNHPSSFFFILCLFWSSYSFYSWSLIFDLYLSQYCILTKILNFYFWAFRNSIFGL